MLMKDRWSSALCGLAGKMDSTHVHFHDAGCCSDRTEGKSDVKKDRKADKQGKEVVSVAKGDGLSDLRLEMVLTSLQHASPLGSHRNIAVTIGDQHGPRTKGSARQVAIHTQSWTFDLDISSWGFLTRSRSLGRMLQVAAEARATCSQLQSRLRPSNTQWLDTAGNEVSIWVLGSRQKTG